MKVVAVANQKGGVGKSTTAANVAVSLAQYGCRVLSVDWDSQIGLTDCLGIPDDDGHPSVLAVLADPPEPLRKSIQSTKYPNLDHVAAHIDLAHAEFNLIMHWAERPSMDLLGESLASVAPAYDVAIVDCPPSFSALTLMALKCADTVLIPVQCNFHSLRGVDRSLSIIEQLLNRTGMDAHILRTMVRTNTRVNRIASERLIEMFGNAVLPTAIKHTVGFDESVLARLPYVIFDPLGDAAEAYRAVALEVANRADVKSPGTRRTQEIDATPRPGQNPVRGDAVWIVPATLPDLADPRFAAFCRTAFSAGGHYSAWTDPAGYIFGDEAKAEDFVKRINGERVDALRGM